MDRKTMTALPPTLKPRVPAPVNIWRILHGDDPTLLQDTIDLYDALVSKLGYAGLGHILVYEYPWLEDAPLIRKWWILGNIAAETPVAWVLDAPYPEIHGGLSVQRARLLDADGGEETR